MRFGLRGPVVCVKYSTHRRVYSSSKVRMRKQLPFVSLGSYEVPAPALARTLSVPPCAVEIPSRFRRRYFLLTLIPSSRRIRATRFQLTSKVALVDRLGFTSTDRASSESPQIGANMAFTITLPGNGFLRGVDCGVSTYFLVRRALRLECHSTRTSTVSLPA